ncbi:MAG: carbohydrate ABC transporter permease [Limnochordia bacterium]
MSIARSDRLHSFGTAKFRQHLRVVLFYLLLSLGAIVFMAPFLFMVISSLKPIHQIATTPIKWWPNPIMWSNYVGAVTVQPLGRFFLNSAFITCFNVLGAVFSCTLAGWGFAQRSFPGRNFLFMLVLSVMMIPSQVTMIPLYMMYSRLGWIDTYLPLIVPSFFGQAFFVFLARQFFLSLPDELSEAAIVDGCSPLGVFYHIALPLVKPLVVTIAIFVFQFTWNDFFGPLIYLTTKSKFTVALGLTAYTEEGFTRWDYLMAASTLAILPVALVFFSFQQYFVQGIATTGMKE